MSMGMKKHKENMAKYDKDMKGYDEKTEAKAYNSHDVATKAKPDPRNKFSSYESLMNKVKNL